MKTDWVTIFAEGLSYVEGLPYKIGPRQLFYHAMDRFDLRKDCWPNFKAALADRRKNFKDGWKPDTLCDTVRNTYFHGFGPATEEEYVKRLVNANISMDIWRSDEIDFYVEVWVESEAMYGQFNHYLGEPYGVTLRPFRGDFSLPAKWDTAEHIETVVALGKDVTVLYFGDCDKKGRLIPQSALRDVRKWSRVPFKFETGGLTVEQAANYVLLENLERPGQWQWEALTDGQAHDIIMAAFESHVRVAELREVIRKSSENLLEWRKHAKARLTKNRSKTQRRALSKEAL